MIALIARLARLPFGSDHTVAVREGVLNHRCVMPHFDVEPTVEYEPGRLRSLTAEEIIDGFAVVRDYQHLRAFDWSEVDACLRAERAVLDDASRRARSDREFEDMMSAAENEAFESDEGDQTYFGLDIGTAALVLGLCAALGLTFYSCRGHVPGSRHEADFPQVGVVLDMERAAIIARLSAETSCGFRSDSGGKLWAFGRSVDDLHRLAGAVSDSHAEFDALPEPEWVGRVNELYSEW